MTFVYNVLFLIFAVISMPLMFIKGKWHGGMKKRWGAFDESTSAKLKRKPNIWVHAVSVGEVMAVSSLIKELKAAYPDYQIVCTCTTPTGYDAACQNFSREEIIFFAPFDLSWVVRKFIKNIAPRVYISAETEIWPNTYRQLKKAQVPVVIVNGRISDKTYLNYRRFGFLMKDILECVTFFCMQSDIDRQRILDLGAEKKSVVNAGNVKFDADQRVEPFDLGKNGYSIDHQLFVAGSTHPGEEKLLIDLFKKLSGEHSNLRLVIAPRHVERADHVCDIVREAGLMPVKFSCNQLSSIDQKTILVIDMIGQLRPLYKAAFLVFVGKSLIDGGGQNIIEPAIFEKPVIIGPYMQNFKHIVELFLNEDAVIQVNNASELASKVEEILNDPPKAFQLGLRARAVVEKNKGANEETMAVLRKFIK